VPWHGHNGMFCHGCGGHRDEVGKLSNRYKCADCGDRAILENRHQLEASSGPYFDHWRRRCLRAFGVGLVDAPAETR